MDTTAYHQRLFSRVKITKYLTMYRVYACFHLVFLLYFFLGYRLQHESYHEVTWIVALGCELWFGLEWILDHNMRWSQLDSFAFPERLASRYGGESASKLPAVDIFVTTTDPYKEPPIITINTVLSILAMDYPVDKMACYVSDDGAAPITFYSLVEASRFAKKWVPYCRKYSIQTRAPFMYFFNQINAAEVQSPDFLQKSLEMKREYEDLERRTTKALETREIPVGPPHNDLDAFPSGSSDVIHRLNNSTAVQIIYENKVCIGRECDALPHLIYVAREKRPERDRHYKAGALNTLARVSAVMTNAPFILNVDCDMHVSNSKAIQHAMCFFLDCESEKDCAFVQFPQIFHGALKDDPFANQFKVQFKTIFKGMDGIQGPVYSGTGCFLRRKALYGVPPFMENQSKERPDYTQDSHDFSSTNSRDKALRNIFGDSAVVAASARKISRDTNLGTTTSISNSVLSSAIKEALKVASADYETNTAWGKEVGWMYGSTSEDVMTSIKLHSLGWRSIYCSPERPAFMGYAARNAPDSFVQHRRWASGMFEIFLSKLCPILGRKKKIMARQRMVYAYLNLWAVWSIPMLCYSILPAFSLLSGRPFLPKISEPAFTCAVALFVSVYGFRLVEYVQQGCSVREWWNNQRMWAIVSVSSWLFALGDVLSKLIGLSETVFVVTPKTSEDENDDAPEEGEFTFDSSPLFIPPTALLLANLIAIAISTVHMVEDRDLGWTNMPLAEYTCSVWTVINLWPFLKGLAKRGTRGIPWPVVRKSCILTVVFCSLFSCTRLGFGR